MHLPIDRKVYPSEANIWKSREVAFANIPFSIPLNLQQLMGLLCTFNVVHPWDRSNSYVTFHTENILLEEPKASLETRKRKVQWLLGMS